MKKKLKIVTAVSLCIGVIFVLKKIFSKKTKEFEEELKDLDFDETDEYGF